MNNENHKLEEVNYPKVKRFVSLTLEKLLNMKDNEEFHILHSNIKGIQLKIRKDFRIESVLNQPVVFFGEKLIIEDNLDKVWPKHDVLLGAEEMLTYIDELLSCKTPSLYKYTRTLKEKGLSVDDIIEFDNGVKGVIYLPKEDETASNILYIPLKADGTLSKHKPRLIYGNSIYQKIGVSDTHE